jgi:hypothetical protein
MYQSTGNPTAFISHTQSPILHPQNPPHHSLYSKKKKKKKKKKKLPTMVAIHTLLTVAITQLAITASAGDCKTFQMYCGSTLKWRGMSCLFYHLCLTNTRCLQVGPTVRFRAKCCKTLGMVEDTLLLRRLTSRCSSAWARKRRWFGRMDVRRAGTVLMVGRESRIIARKK